MMLRCWDIKRKNDPWICFSHYPIIPRTMGESVTTMHEPFQAIATVIGSRHIPFPSRAIRCHSCCTTRRVSTCNDTSPCCTCSCHAICFRLFFFFFLFPFFAWIFPFWFFPGGALLHVQRTHHLSAFPPCATGGQIFERLVSESFMANFSGKIRKKSTEISSPR